MSWDKKYYELAKFVAQWSKDDTKIGAVIVNTNNSVISLGFNGISRGVQDKPERLLRPIKYKFVCHGEMNSLFNAAYNGVSTKDCTMYVSTYHCCAQCAAGVINAGIKRVVCPEPDMKLEKWKEDFEIAQMMFEEAKIKVDYIYE